MEAHLPNSITKASRRPQLRFYLQKPNFAVTVDGQNRGALMFTGYQSRTKLVRNTNIDLRKAEQKVPTVCLGAQGTIAVDKDECYVDAEPTNQCRSETMPQKLLMLICDTTDGGNYIFLHCI